MVLEKLLSHLGETLGLPGLALDENNTPDEADKKAGIGWMPRV